MYLAARSPVQLLCQPFEPILQALNLIIQLSLYAAVPLQGQHAVGGQVVGRQVREVQPVALWKNNSRNGWARTAT